MRSQSGNSAIRQSGNLLLLFLLLTSLALAADAPTLEVSKAAPRQIEDATQKAIVRDYTRAWEALTRALEHNDRGALDASFIGVARERLASRIEGQLAAGLQTKLAVRGHKMDALFYSPDGSAMQLRDTAQLELQVLDGGTVLHREQVTIPYLVLMTVAEDRWKVRLMEELPQE
jgi:hypothetical protein